MSPTERLDPQLDEGRGVSHTAGGSRLGELLRRARQDKGLSVEELSRKTRLRPSIIRAMEEGRSEELPSHPFVLGYMKLLARHLGLVEKELVELYNAEAGRRDKGIGFAAPADGSPNRPGKITVLGGVAVFLLLFAAYGANQSGGLSGIWQELSAGRLPALTATQPSAPVVSPPAKEPPAKEKKPAPLAEVKKSELISALPMETPKPGSTPSSASAPAVAASASVPGTAPAAVGSPPPAASVVASPPAPAVADAGEPPPPPEEESEFAPSTPATVPAAATVTPTGSVATSPPAGKKYMRWEALGLDENGVAPSEEIPVTIEANRKVWVQIQDNDGNVVKDMVLKEKQRFYIFNGTQYNITVGNAAAVSLAQKDAVLPVLGPEGKVVKMLNLSEETLRKRAAGTP